LIFTVGDLVLFLPNDVERFRRILLVCSVPQKLGDQVQFLVAPCLPTSGIMNKETWMIRGLECLVDVVVALFIAVGFFGLHG
jgi:hypothetical protein